jgi:hypothetical protein
MAVSPIGAASTTMGYRFRSTLINSGIDNQMGNNGDNAIGSHRARFDGFVDGQA